MDNEAIGDQRTPTSRENEEDERTKPDGSPDGNPDDVDIKLKRKIGPLVGITIVVGAMLGSGIFITPSIVLASSGSVGATLIIWAVSGVASTMGALCYIELGTMIQESGGDYVYIYRAFGGLPAFLYCWVTTLIAAPTMLAIIASAFSNYMLYPFFPHAGGGGACGPPGVCSFLFSAMCLTLVTYLNIYSVKWLTRAQAVCTLLVAVALVVIIIAGMIRLGEGHTENFVDSFQTLPGLSTTSGSIAVAFYGALFTYGGWSVLNFLIEELKDPVRDLPIVILVSLPLVAVINVLVNIAYFAVLKPEEILMSNAVAFTFGQKVLGAASWVMPFAVAIAMIGGMNGGLLKGSRVCMVGAQRGHLPHFLGMIQIRRKTPAPALLFVTSLGMIFLTLRDIRQLLNYFSFVIWSTVLASTLALLYLRWKQPTLPRPFKVNIILPVLFSVLATALLVFGVVGAPMDAVIGVSLTLTGVPFYVVFIYWTNKPRWLRKITFTGTVFLQKLVAAGYEDSSSK